jgi:hypothetical protein
MCNEATLGTIQSNFRLNSVKLFHNDVKNETIIPSGKDLVRSSPSINTKPLELKFFCLFKRLVKEKLKYSFFGRESISNVFVDFSMQSMFYVGSVTLRRVTDYAAGANATYTLIANVEQNE